MRTVAEHQEAIRALLAPLANRAQEVVPVGTDAALLRRTLATDLASPIDHPPFDNSQMDGFAVHSAAVVAGQPFAVAPRIAAGAPTGTLPHGSVAPIMTGAPIPRGADAVIPIEAATPDSFPPESGEHTVRFDRPVPAGTFVRGRGTDLAAGAVLLAAGTRLGPAQLAVIAASGITEVGVLRPVRVLVISTGDELQQPGAPLSDGRIYDANSVAMAASVAMTGAVPQVLHAMRDDAAELARVVAASAPSVDIVLTTGGVSKGAYEVVRDVFEPAGVRFAAVAMQPGGPQGWGEATLPTGSVPVVAFPGNPVSALISFQVFLAPVLRMLHGLPPRVIDRAPLAEPVQSPAGKHQVRRGRLTDSGEVALVGAPSSHLLHHYASSTHLVHLPLGVSTLAAGDTVEIWRIDD